MLLAETIPPLTALVAKAILSNVLEAVFYYDGSNDNYKNYNFFNFAKNIRIRGKKFSLKSKDDIVAIAF